MAGKDALQLRINGQDHQVLAPSAWTLLEVLRYELGLTGTKQGCDKGDCGACTVLLDGQPALACLTLATLAQGCEIQTIEGLDRRLARAFDAAGALQCGFCQPGMVVSAVVGVPLAYEDQVFRWARALYMWRFDMVAAGPRMLSRGHSREQRESRAFAAELLAPAAAIRRRLSGALVDDAEVGEIANSFQVRRRVAASRCCALGADR